MDRSNERARAWLSHCSTLFTSVVCLTLLVGCATAPLSRFAVAQEQSQPQEQPAKKDDQGQVAVSDTSSASPSNMDEDRAELMYEVMIAELAGRRGYMDIAAEVYLRAANRSDDPRIAERATKLAVWARQWPVAQKAAKRWLLIDPDSAEARDLLAQVLILSTQDKPAESLDDIKAVLDQDPDNVALRIGYARLLAEVGQYKEASVQLEYLFENSADDANVLLSIGLLALDSMRTDEAKKYFDALLASGDHSDQANYYLARIDDQFKRYEEAINHYEQVGEGELYFSSQLRVAELYSASERLELGVEKLRALSEFLPDPSMAPMLVTTESRMLIDAGQAENAIAVLSDGIEKFPNSGELLYARALAADAMGDTDMLMTDLENLLIAEPNNANALNALGYYLVDENIRLGEAELLLEKAISLKPDDPAIMDSLGWLRFRQGDREAAKTLLEAAYALLPDAEIAAHLGEVLWMNGDKTAAQSIWDKALLDDPEHIKLTDTVERLTQ